MAIQTGWPVNAAGQIVVSGSGDIIVGVVSEDFIPVGADGGVSFTTPDNNRVSLVTNSPEAASANYTIIQQALNAGGTVDLSYVGGETIYISDTLLIGSNTQLVLHRARLKNLEGANKTLLKSKMFTTPFTDVTIAISNQRDVTVTLVNHGYKEGDAVWLSGSDQSNYRGIFYVTQILSQNTFLFSILRPTGITPTGTARIKRPDSNVTITGGIFDYNRLGTNDTVANNQDKICIILGGNNLEVNNIVGNDLLKYILAVGACRDFRVNGVNGVWANSDIVKVYGPAFNGFVSNITGSTLDDALSFQCKEPPVFSAYEFTDKGGDIIDCKGVNINPTYTGSSPCTLYLSPDEFMDQVGFDGVTSLSTVNIPVRIVPGDGFSNCTVGSLFVKNVVHNSGDNAAVKAGGIGTKISRIDIENVRSLAKGNDTPAPIIELYGAGTKIDVATLTKIERNSVDAPLINVSCSIDNLYLNGCRHYGKGFTLFVSLGEIKNVFIDKLIAKGVTKVARVKNSLTAPINFFFSNCDLDGLGVIETEKTGTNVSIRDTIVKVGVDGMIRLNGGTDYVVKLGNGFVLASGDLVTRVGSEPLELDGGSNARVALSRIKRVDGCSVYNTDPTVNNNVSGDGPTSVGLYTCVGTALGSWKKLGTDGGAGNRY